jgi:ABC-type phosphate/phosphonate transport system substrate-binding protein
MDLCQALEKLFGRAGIDFDWILYSGYDAMVDAFVRKEIDLAWNGPLSYVKIQRLLDDPCQVIAMRDVDLNFITHFITQPNSDIITVEDLPGKSFALGGRNSVEAGLLPYHFLKQAGINPGVDLAKCTFYDQRPPSGLSDQHDVAERVGQGEYEAGAISQRALDGLVESGGNSKSSLRVFRSSPGYSHCCFTAQNDLDPELSRQIAQTFTSVQDNEPVGKSVLEAEDCAALVPGITEGWEILERAAAEEGLI